MAKPYQPEKKDSINKSSVSNIGGDMSSPTPVTDSMNLESFRKPLESFKDDNEPLKMYGGGSVKKYAKGGGTRPVRR